GCPAQAMSSQRRSSTRMKTILGRPAGSAAWLFTGDANSQAPASNPTSQREDGPIACILLIYRLRRTPKLESLPLRRRLDTRQAVVGGDVKRRAVVAEGAV